MCVALAAAVPVFGGEYAVLANGFRIHAERHSMADSSVLLYTKDGVTEIPASMVVSFEIEEYTAPVAAVQPPAVPLVLEKDAAALLRDAAHRTGLPLALVES